MTTEDYTSRIRSTLTVMGVGLAVLAGLTANTYLTPPELPDPPHMPGSGLHLPLGGE